MEKRELLFALDRGCKNAASYAIQMIRLPKYLGLKKIIDRNTELRTIKEKDKCYIVGLGPSLKQVDFNKLSDGDMITVNYYHKDSNALIKKPLLHIMLDGLLYTTEREDLELALASFPDSNFLLNAKYYESKLDGSKKYWICTWGPERIPNKIDLTRVCPSFDNVINHAIYVALYMGYKEIVLLGCDFNSFASRKLSHSYGESERTLSLSYELFAYSFVAASHMKLADYSNNNKVRIINASYGSLIDAYKYDEEMAKNLMKE